MIGLTTKESAHAPSIERDRGRRDAASTDADATVMAAFREKAPGAAEALYDRYAKRVYGLGLALLRDPTDAEDLVQGTFLKAWRRASTFDPNRGALDKWFLLIARGLAIDLIRRRTLEAKKLSANPVRSEASEEPGPEQYAEQHDLIRHARKAMDQLPPAQRAALELSYIEGRTSTEVAALEGIPVGTAKTRIRLGIITLRKTLSEGRAANRRESTGRDHPFPGSTDESVGLCRA
jgi:RNA polymerase sigma-70 factor, ECF subfamily